MNNMAGNKRKTVTLSSLMGDIAESIHVREQILKEIGYINNFNTRGKREAMRCKYWCVLALPRLRALLRIATRIYVSTDPANIPVTVKELQRINRSASQRFGRGTVIINPANNQPILSTYTAEDSEEIPF